MRGRNAVTSCRIRNESMSDGRGTLVDWERECRRGRYFWVIVGLTRGEVVVGFVKLLRRGGMVELCLDIIRRAIVFIAGYLRLRLGSRRIMSTG